jgi:hypothetical protein
MDSVKLEELFLRYMDRFVDLEVAKDQAFAKWKSYRTMGTPESDAAYDRYVAAVDAINDAIQAYNADVRKIKQS